MLNKGIAVTLYNLTQDPADREQSLDLVPLMLVRNNEPILVPDIETPLAIGDCILFCGRPEAKSTVPILLDHVRTLTYIVDGIEIPDSLVWRWLTAKLKRNLI